MFDTLKITAPIDVPPQHFRGNTTFQYNNLTFSPVFIKGTNTVKYFNSTYNNLDLVIRDNQLTISNSFHKFYHGNNYTDYTLSQFKETINTLSDIFSTDITQAQIQKIAWGCNIPHNKPSSIYTNWQSLRGKQPLAMVSKNKQYGNKFHLTNYSFKAYNKTQEVKMHDGITIDDSLLRVEVEVKYLKQLQTKGIAINTVNSLLNPTIYNVLITEFLNTYAAIQHTPQIDYTNLPLNQARILAGMQALKFVEHLKKNHNSTYKKDISTYRKLTIQHTTQSIDNLLKDKLNYLANN